MVFVGVCGKVPVVYIKLKLYITYYTIKPQTVKLVLVPCFSLIVLPLIVTAMTRAGILNILKSIDII